MNKDNLHIDLENNIKGLQSNNDKTREKYFKIIYPLSDLNPELLYPYWDTIVEMLKKPEVSNKYYAIHLIANIIKVDVYNRFDEVFNYWFNDLLNFESPVVSPHIAEKSGMIARVRPDLEIEITQLLLNIEETSKCRHIDLQKAYILSAFDMYFESISNKVIVIEFIKAQQDNPSPKTRKKAKELIEKYNIE